jgi:hypothetical protein
MQASTDGNTAKGLLSLEPVEVSSTLAYTIQYSKQLCGKGFVQGTQTESGFVENIGACF